MPKTKLPYALGFKDRGMGYGDWSVMSAEGQVIARMVEILPVDGMSLEEYAETLCSRENADFIILACNHHDEMFEALEEVLRRLSQISILLNSGATPKDIQDAYNAAYPGKLRELIKKIRPDTPHDHCELCGFHTHEIKDCPYKE